MPNVFPGLVKEHSTVDPWVGSGVRRILDSIPALPFISCLTLKQNNSTSQGLGFFIYKTDVIVSSTF
jgi:hypothetical protein